MEIQTNSTKSITLGIGPHDELVTQMGELEIKILMMMASHALLGICFLRGAPLLRRCSNTMELNEYITTGDTSTIIAPISGGLIAADESELELAVPIKVDLIHGDTPLVAEQSGNLRLCLRQQRSEEHRCPAG
jgi:hypothetical protein